MAGEKEILDAIREVNKALTDLSSFVRTSIAELKTQQMTADKNITELWRNINEFEKEFNSQTIILTEQKGAIANLKREMDDAFGYAKRLEGEIKAAAGTISDMQSQAKGMKLVVSAVIGIATVIGAVQVIRSFAHG